MRAADAVAAEDEVSFVLVPADTSKPLEEQTFRPPPNATGDLLLDYLKPLFAPKSHETVDIGLLQDQATKTLAGTPGAPATVSDDALKQVAAEAHVECFTLVHPIPSNRFTAIHIYLDEVGMLKRLPLNRRASDFAAQAGFNPPPTFYGNVYLARVQHQPVLRHLSFVMGPDTSMDAPWLQVAATENLEYQMEMNRITGRKDAQPEVAGQNQAKQEDGYQWSQTEEEMELRIPVDAETASKNVKVKFLPKKVQVDVQQQSNFNLSIVLFEHIDVDGCTWTLEKEGSGSKSLVVTMEKVEQAFWPRIKD